ncbi:MAG: hypothetical protein A2X12_11290 [Bacteroidetes bacterium GWE2_29_8]|nr:MAG: hypothetical protein A2X12_11290 [Bacteroidetes bacterium GWE2_29_8]OFY17430.1 MAG: hypothetical protein A2X02_00855 [Bacteroidetes bacterium GWF2_29_10]
MNNLVKIKKGYNIELEGAAQKEVIIYNSDYCAICPTNFRYVTPKLLVNEGDTVKVGTALFYDKNNEKILFTSPVSGVVERVKRGDKRRIEAIEIKSDKNNESLTYDINTNNIDNVKEILLKSGLWVSIRQRPYSCIANPENIARDIYVSCFDSSPLGADIDDYVKSNYKYFRKGLDILGILTNGNIYLGINLANEQKGLYKDLSSDKIIVNKFEGPHPVGNVGIQIHHTKPINKGEVVWYLYPLDIIRIGYLFTNGTISAETFIALAGTEVTKPCYIQTTIGANIAGLIKDNLKNQNVRIISGNVLTGEKIEKDGYIGYYHNMITIIEEGDYYEMIGWALPGLNKLSFSKTFLSALLPNKKLKIDTNFHGGERAFVMTGQYEKVLPMDIMPMQLLKAALAGDIDLMEQLGIYEVDEEDFALCEFICPSKIEIQSILREGIDLIRKEMN